MPEKTPVSFVLLDNHHLKEHGIRYFCEKSKHFVLITTNKHHPAFNVREENLHIICQEKLSLTDALKGLKKHFSCERFYPEPRRSGMRQGDNHHELQNH